MRIAMCLFTNVTRVMTIRKVIAHKPTIERRLPGEHGSPILGKQNCPIETITSSSET